MKSKLAGVTAASRRVQLKRANFASEKLEAINAVKRYKHQIGEARDELKRVGREASAAVVKFYALADDAGSDPEFWGDVDLEYAIELADNVINDLKTTEKPTL